MKPVKPLIRVDGDGYWWGWAPDLGHARGKRRGSWFGPFLGEAGYPAYLAAFNFARNSDNLFRHYYPGVEPTRPLRPEAV